MTLLAALWGVVVQLAPSLLLGAAIAGLLHVALPPDFLARQMRGRGGVAKAVALGVPLPLCSCGVLPAGLGLRREGASDGATVGFLISTPQTGVDSILVSASFLGWPFALFKVASAAITGVVGGWLADRTAPEPPAAPEPVASETVAEQGPAWRIALGEGVDLLRMIWGWLVVGIVISAAIEIFVPPSAFASFAGLGVLGAALAAFAVSLPLYVCATASVPIAAALVSGGMPAGAALVFLMAGPATNAATVGALYRAIGGRLLAVYLVVITVGSIGFALAFDFLLGSATAHHVAHEHGTAIWQQALGLLLVALLAWFAVEDLRRWRRSRRALTRAAPPVEVAVDGMRCEGCTRHLEEVLLGSDLVQAAEITLSPGRAVVHGSATPDEVRRLVVAAGYQAR